MMKKVNWKKIQKYLNEILNEPSKEIEKVNWRHQYKLDNIFNIILNILGLCVIFINPYFTIIPIFIGLMVNLSAYNFFDEKRFK